MDAGVTATLIHLRQTGGIVVTLWAQAGETVYPINTCAPIVTGVDGTIIDVDVTHCPCKTKEYDLSTMQQILSTPAIMKALQLQCCIF